MYPLLNSSVAIVTGGARDIGRQVSVKLAGAGAKVCVNYLSNTEEADETLRLIKEAGGEAIAVQADMTKAEEVKKVVAACTEAYGDTIHILVNVVGGLVTVK